MVKDKKDSSESHGSVNVLFGFGKRVGENGIANGHDGGECEQQADAVFRPNPAADRARKDGDEMIDGDTRGHRGG